MASSDPMAWIQQTTSGMEKGDPKIGKIESLQEWKAAVKTYYTKQSLLLVPKELPESLLLGPTRDTTSSRTKMAPHHPLPQKNSKKDLT